MIRYDQFLQTSPALVALPVGTKISPGTLGIYEFLSKSFACVSVNALQWLEHFLEGMQWTEALSGFPELTEAELWAEISDLVECNFIGIEGSAVWSRQSNYRREWKWDLSSALFHFTVSDGEFYSEDSCRQILNKKFAASPGPAKYCIHSDNAIRLPPLENDEAKCLLSLLFTRRTNRGGAGHPINRHHIGACLAGSLGIVGEVQSPSGPLPLKPTPSGGARNPFDAYVLVNCSDDLEPGVYQYSPYTHSLLQVPSTVAVDQRVYFAQQDWTAGKSVIIFLVANFDRIMWKYSDPNAYRVMLIEAGHIGQNILLIAHSQGINACPTAALAHSQVSTALGLKDILQQPVYAITLDKAGPYIEEVVPNDNFVPFLGKMEFQ